MEQNKRKSQPCCVPGCKDHTSSRFRFPNPNNEMDTFLEWLKVIKRGELNNSTPHTVYNKFRVCSRHFKDEDKVRVGRRAITRIAIPRLFLPAIGSQNAADIEEEETQTIRFIDMHGNIKYSIFFDYARPSTSQQDMLISDDSRNVDDCHSEANIEETSTKRKFIDMHDYASPSEQDSRNADDFQSEIETPKNPNKRKFVGMHGNI
ncbi:uncharacterized protein [Diabrotica undecimpunctata]|uniref:uncharacterized protein n=1 Tax=Diabrotica undecimpunctata TaxID=50387 RepID=UPI003B641828